MSTVQSLLHGEGCRSGGSVEQAACEPVPALAENSFQTKKEDAHFEWAFKCLKSLCGVCCCRFHAWVTAFVGPQGLSEEILAHPQNHEILP